MWCKRQMLTLMQLVVLTKKGYQGQSDLRVFSLCNLPNFFLLIRLETAHQHGDSCRGIGPHWQSVCNGGRSVKSPPDRRCHDIDGEINFSIALTRMESVQSQGRGQSSRPRQSIFLLQFRRSQERLSRYDGISHTYVTDRIVLSISG
jgi:hypothetical protein